MNENRNTSQIAIATAVSSGVSAVVAFLTALALTIGLGMTQGNLGAKSQDSSSGSRAVTAAPDLSQPQFSHELTPKQKRELRRITDTPEERAQLAADLAAAFDGVATVGVSGPSSSSSQLTVSTISDTGSYDADEVLAYGATSSHVWITASYADMAAGAIWGAVQYCKYRKVPGWLCDYAGNKLTEWARGWGWASNHGVWAAVYYYGRFDGGRW